MNHCNMNSRLFIIIIFHMKVKVYAIKMNIFCMKIFQSTLFWFVRNMICRFNS